MFVTMVRDTLNRVTRLETLRGLLASGDPATLPDLARTLGVSVRTLARDVALLRETGVPVEGDRGRGGGVRLPPAYRTGRVHLADREAVDLLLAMAVAESLGTTLFLPALGAVRRKIAAAFPDRHLDRIRDLRRRILVGRGASDAVRATWRPPARAGVSAVADAFLGRERIEIDYAAADADTATTRTIEPHYLLCNPPVWYVIAFDGLREAPRSFRLDRVRAVRPTGTRFRLMPRERLVDVDGIEATDL
jgi:predicted DNA-binding transcriptional regulator YafY